MRLVDERFVDTILTTNFDNVFLDLCAAHHRPHHIEVIRTVTDCTTMLSTWPRYPQYLFLHGTVEHYTDKNRIDEVQQLNSTLVDRLVPLLRDRPLIVIGYRGAEPSIIRHLFIDQAAATNSFRHGLFWCALPQSIDAGLHPLVRELHAAIGSNLQLVPIAGFDEVLEQIAISCEQKGSPGMPVSPAVVGGSTPVVPFDMTALADARLEELDWVRVQAVICEYCQRMDIAQPAAIDRPWLIDRLCDLDLAVRAGNEIWPTVSGYLLFGGTPKSRIPGANTIIRGDGRDERHLDGNLWAQLEVLTDVLADLNQPFRLKGTISENVYPYPPLALKELVVNALVHRAYNMPEPIHVEISETFLRITNPGGLVEPVYTQVNLDLQEQIEKGVRGIKGYRNPVLADLFYGAGAMDKTGSGLPDVQVEVRRSGGQVAFGPTRDNNSFRAVIYRRTEVVDQATKTAQPTSPQIKYSGNLLEIVSRPDTVWWGRSDVAPSAILHSTTSQAIPPFLWKHGGELITFANLTDPDNPLSTFVIDGSVSAYPAEDMEAKAETRRDLVWLYNECFYEHCYRHILNVDRTRKRAYFPRTDKGPREITYQATFRHATRTVTKPFVSRKTQRTLYWEHEAFWFGFAYFNGAWALRLLPGYVFTVDGRSKLLHHSRVGALATKKSARDFNQQVLNDLVFWTWVLSDGADSFLLGTGGEQAIHIRGALLACELTTPLGSMDDIRHEATALADQELAEIEEEIAEAAEAEWNIDEHTD
jgi:hypothetical protein